MKLIIDIDKDYYKAIWENGYIYDEDNEDIAKIIKNGKPLPKRHGDLIDRDELLNSSCLWEFHRYDDYSKASKIIKNIPTIIESDKENLYG